MIMKSTYRRPYRTLLAIGTVVGAVALSASLVQAGECPAGKSAVNGQPPGPSMHSNVTDKVIASIDLAKEAPRLQNSQFRLRRLVVQPGGVVAWHSHEERPAIIYIVSGTIREYSSTCTVPITHRAGEVAVETHKTQHWWKNHGRTPVVLLSADILHQNSDPKTM